MTWSGPSSEPAAAAQHDPNARRLYAEELERRLDDILFASPSHRSATRLAEGLEPLPRERQEQVLHWADVAAHTYAEIGYLIVSLAPQAYDRLDAPGFEAWVLAGLDAYDKQGGREAMAQLRDIDGFCAARSGPQFARFEEVEARLSRFVQGLAGRPLALAAGGDSAWTDTERIYLPLQLARLPGAEANRRLYKALAVMLWAQTHFGTFNADLDAELMRWPDRERALGWLSALEAVRLESRIARELPGLAAELAALRGPWPAQLASAVKELARPQATVADSLALLAQCMAQAGAAPQLPQSCMLDPAAARAVREARIARETEVLRRAISVLKGSGGRSRNEEGQVMAALSADGGNVEITLDGEAVALPPEAQAAAQSLVQDLGELPPEALTPAGPGAWKPTAREGAGPEAASDRQPDRRYDEWDYRRGAYRLGWCHLYESDVSPGNPDYVAEVKARYAGLIGQLRKRFEALRGEDRILGRQDDGDDIDVDALVEALADRLGGAEPSNRLFSRRVRNDRSLAAMFMVDMSGSTKGWINDAEREALVMLCEALEMLGDRYAIYGFSGWTRTRCDIYRIKRFAESYGDAVRRRIAAVEAKDYTRMGVAIRHLTGLLEREPARHKLLITLSDGRPDDFGDEYRGFYGIEDTRRALQEASEKGVRSYCITIDRHGADYLKHMYGPAHYTVLDDVKKLPLKVADIYRRLAT